MRHNADISGATLQTNAPLILNKMNVLQGHFGRNNVVCASDCGMGLFLSVKSCYYQPQQTALGFSTYDAAQGKDVTNTEITFKIMLTITEIYIT